MNHGGHRDMELRSCGRATPELCSFYSLNYGTSFLCYTLLI